MNISRTYAQVVFGAVFALCTSVMPVFAGDIVMSTSDSAPLYPTSGSAKNTEVVIGTTSNQASVATTVTLTTKSDDGGPVFASFTPSVGVYQVSDAGWGTSSEVTTFAFTSTTIGLVNTIGVSVTHDDFSTLTVCTNNKSLSYTICIPQISESVDANPGFAMVNQAGGFSFYAHYTITGCDDFSQILITQNINSSTTEKDLKNLPYVDASQAGKVGYQTSGFVQDTGWPWQAVRTTATDAPNPMPAGTVMMGDSQVFPVNTKVVGTTFFGTVITGWNLADNTRSFQDIFCRSSDPSHSPIATATWGYEWVNSNAEWTTTSSPPIPSPYVVAGCDYFATPPATAGKFQSSNGITGL